MDVLVTGGTGWLGRHVVRELRTRGHRARVLSRRPSSDRDRFAGDLETGVGLAEAVAGSEAIIHAATGARRPWKVRHVDIEGTARLLELARGAGTGHVLYTSIVGMEKVRSYPYYRVKLQAERVVGAGGVPFSILRATQFPELIDLLLRASSVVPRVMFVGAGLRFQVVHPRDVARRLVDVVEGPPAGMLPDFCGPKVQPLTEMAEAWRGARGSDSMIIKLPPVGRTMRAFARGASLCPGHADGQLTWEDWLAERYGPREVAAAG